jgi:hypothetical protein
MSCLTYFPMPDSYWSRDIFHGLLASILKDDIQLAGKLVMDSARDADAARLRHAFKPCRHVDAIPQYVLAIDDDVAKINPHAVLDALILGNIGGTSSQLLLYLNAALHGIYDAWELDQKPVAGCLDDAATVGGYAGVKNLLTMSPLARNRAFLIQHHESRVADHVG